MPPEPPHHNKNSLRRPLLPPPTTTQDTMNPSRLRKPYTSDWCKPRYFRRAARKSNTTGSNPPHHTLATLFVIFQQFYPTISMDTELPNQKKLFPTTPAATLTYYKERHNEPFQTPKTLHIGPKPQENQCKPREFRQASRNSNNTGSDATTLLHAMSERGTAEIVHPTPHSLILLCEP